MQIQSTRKPLNQTSADWVAIGLFDDPGTVPAGLLGTPLASLIQRLSASDELATGVGDVTILHGEWGIPAGTVVLFGLGSRSNFSAGQAFSSGLAVAKKLSSKARRSVAVYLPTPEPAHVSALVEGLVVGMRGPGLRKSEPARHPFDSLELVAEPECPLSDEALASAVRRGEIGGSAVVLARELVNTPPSEKSPTVLARRFREVAEEAGLSVDVWDLERIKAERFGALLGVAAGSDQPPAFVRMDYRKGGDGPILALVGKGVTFDSGGLSLKPSASMEDMKADMTGSAVVLACLQAVARLELPVNVTGYVALTENMTGGGAMKLGDVLTTRNGTTVEVLNTDAEGRLILADALSYAAEQKPDRILDLATLTGACMVALGTKVAGLFSTEDAFAEQVLEASRLTGERAWRMPLFPDFADQLKSHVADLKNIGGKWGGSITAAKFLERFVDGIPWVHLDVAGPSWSEAETGTQDVGGTGCFVRTLIVLIENQVQRSKS